jgi:hypothetical protein
MQEERKLQEPAGIAFFSIKTGETMYARLEPTIAAFINSSDMGINASRGQDYGWRLDPEWVKKIRAFRNDEDAMDRLAAKLRLEDGQSPSTTQILYYIYGRQVRAYLQSLQEYENPYENQYQDAISNRPTAPVQEQPMPTHLARIAEDEPVTEDVDEADLMPADDEDEPEAAPVEHTEQDQPTQPANENTSTQTRSRRQANKRNTN